MVSRHRSNLVGRCAVSGKRFGASDWATMAVMLPVLMELGSYGRPPGSSASSCSSIIINQDTQETLVPFTLVLFDHDELKS